MSLIRSAWPKAASRTRSQTACIWTYLQSRKSQLCPYNRQSQAPPPVIITLISGKAKPRSICKRPLWTKNFSYRICRSWIRQTLRFLTLSKNLNRSQKDPQKRFLNARTNFWCQLTAILFKSQSLTNLPGKINRTMKNISASMRNIIKNSIELINWSLRSRISLQL